jgi:hypothetical protein
VSQVSFVRSTLLTIYTAFNITKVGSLVKLLKINFKIILVKEIFQKAIFNTGPLVFYSLCFFAIGYLGNEATNFLVETLFRIKNFF